MKYPLLGGMSKIDGLISGWATYVGIGMATGLITSTRATVRTTAFFYPLNATVSSISAIPTSKAVAFTAYK